MIDCVFNKAHDFKLLLLFPVVVEVLINLKAIEILIRQQLIYKLGQSVPIFAILVESKLLD